jgi:hypothetical protein
MPRAVQEPEMMDVDEPAEPPVEPKKKKRKSMRRQLRSEPLILLLSRIS